MSNRRVALKYLEESQLLGEVLYLRELAPMVNKMPNMLDWKKSNFEAVRLDLKEQGLKAGDFTTVDSCKKRFGHEGQERDLEIIRLTDKNGAETFIAGVTPKGQEADIVNPPKVVLTKEKNKITARSSNDVNISSAIDLYVQQTEGLQAHKRALEEGKQAQMLVYATGTGKSFIMVEAAAARGKGIYVVPDIKLAAQLKGDIETLDEDHKTGNIITSARQNQNPAEILAAKHLIITKNDLEDYTRILKNETIYLDEAHEYPKHQIEKLLENGNTVLAVTATPTHELAEIFGNPIASITMDTALNKLNAFRDVKVSDPKQFDKSHDRDERVHQILLDYYKGLTFIENDRLPPDDKILSKYTTLENELIARGVDGAIERVMNANKEPRSGSMNMVFSTNQDLNRQITDAYNAVFEGTYSQQERLAQEVSEERAKISIAETMRLTETRDSIMVKGLANTYISTDVHTVLRKIDPSDVDLNSPDVQKKYASVIELSTVDAQGLKDEVQTAMKQQIANRINREAIGILRGNEGAVRNFQVRGRDDDVLRDKLEQYEVREPRPMLLRTNPSNPDYQAIENALDKIDRKDSMMQALQDKKFSELRVTSGDIDLKNFDVKYAVNMPDNDKKAASKLLDLHKEGMVMHLVNDSSLVTGFSDKDITSVQRFVGGVIETGIIRATQMLGRPVRAKDGVAWASEFLNDTLDREGKSGDKKPFLFSDVLAPDYLERVNDYLVTYEKTHGKSQLPDKFKDASAEPQNTKAKTITTPIERGQ